MLWGRRVIIVFPAVNLEGYGNNWTDNTFLLCNGGKNVTDQPITS